MEKIYNIGLIIIIGLLVWFSHLDREEFLYELTESRNSYIETLSSIEMIKEDVSFIKTYIINKEEENNGYK